jgi:UDP-N-acetylmuramate dehydrogenase
MIERSVSLKEYNTFGFEVGASLFCRISEVTQLKSMAKTTLFDLNNVFILGGGSNILFTTDYQGLVLHNELMGKEILQETNEYVCLKIGAGENWHQVVLHCIENGWGGIENLSLIPGTMGAAPIQNIGAYGSELKDVFYSLEAMDMRTGEIVEFDNTTCRFGYRDSIFKQEGKGRYFILNVTLKLSTHPIVNVQYGDIQSWLETNNVSEPKIQDVSHAVIAIRQSKLPDPEVLGNCGSFFKNPVVPESLFHQLQEQYPDIRHFAAIPGFIKLPAAWQGFRLGDAGVHEKQALVLVNYGNATGSEILELATKIQSSVMQKFGVALEMEVNHR